MAKVLGIGRKELQKRLQISGLNVLSSALTLMESEILNAFPSYESIDDFIKQFIDIVVSYHKLDSIIIDSNICQEVIDKLRERRVSRTGDNQLLVKNVVNSYDNRKTNNYLQHLRQLYKHLERHPIFQSSKNFKLIEIDSLITSNKETIDCIVFGFIFKDSTKINDFVVEDNSGRVPLMFTEETQFRDELIIENSFVLIEGTYSSSKDILLVETIGHSPPIDLKSTIDSSNSIQRLGRMIVVLSDIHLDDNKTFDKLKTLFTGYESVVPIPDSFIFVGDFLSKPYEEVSHFKAHMKNFVKLISRFDKISKLSQLIFVPGFNDSDGQHIPKPSFPIDMFPHTTTKLNNYYLATNPVNIYIDSRHISLFAFPLLSKLKKHIIHDNTEDPTEMGSSLAKHIICNAHLSAGISKNFDSSLSLFHLPDFLLFTDYEIKEDIEGNALDFVDVINLPSFSMDNFKFKVFYTNPKSVESSQILM